MAESTTESARRWQVEDLLDLDYFLQLDAEKDRDGLISRDEEIAKSVLLPVLGEAGMVGDASVQVRSQGFALWLEQMRRLDDETAGSELSLLPGEIFSQVSRLMKWLAGAVMMLLGAGLVFSLLHTEERYFNVMMFLAATLLPQLLLLFVLMLGGVLRRVSGNKKPRGGVAQILVAALMNWLAGKIRSHRSGDHLSSQWQGLKRKNYLLWPVLSLSQVLAVFYNVGILVGFALCLVSMDVRFFWESTPGLAAVETLEQIVGGVSAPWAAMMPDVLPKAEGIAATRITIEGAEEVFPSSELVNSAAVWAPFLSGAVIFWGLLPRLILWLGITVWGRQSLNHYAFVERHHRELWRRLTALRVEILNEGPDDEAVVLLWGGLHPDPDELRKVLLQQLRLNPLQTFAAGNETDSRVDAERIQQVGAKVAGMKEGVRLVVVVESWALAPREATDFLNELRGRVGARRAIRLLLLGAPGSGSGFSDPSVAEVKMWEDLVAERKDAALTVYPYRKSHG